MKASIIGHIHCPSSYNEFSNKKDSKAVRIVIGSRTNTHKGIWIVPLLMQIKEGTLFPDCSTRFPAHREDTEPA